MKVLGMFAAVLVLGSPAALAENGGPSGRGSVLGDPAASSATPGTAPTTGMARSRVAAEHRPRADAMPMAISGETRCLTATGT